MHGLGQCYYEGLGVTANMTRALELLLVRAFLIPRRKWCQLPCLQFAAERGVSKAWYNLGVAMINGAADAPANVSFGMECLLRAATTEPVSLQPKGGPSRQGRVAGMDPGRLPESARFRTFTACRARA